MNGMLSSIALAVFVATLGTSMAAGKLKPTFMVSGGDTIVASAVVTEADRTGKTDATQAIQKAIDAVAAVQGGVVFLPAGRYRIDGSLNLGFGVVLTGEWTNPDRGGIGKGTILLAYSGRGDASKPPLLQVSHEAAVVNLTVYYPEQKPDDIRPYPPTISASLATVRNVTLCNSFYAVDMKAQNASMLAEIYGTALSRGIFAPVASEFSWIHDIHFANRYWGEAAEKIDGKTLTPDQVSSLDRYTLGHLVGLELQRLDGLAVYRFRADDAGTPVRMSKNPKFPHPVFGYGGVAAGLEGRRDEQGWAPWYYGMRYANVDNVPEARGKSYTFAKNPQPAKVDPASFFDVTQAPYSAVGDGTADDTSAVKKALVDAERHGGGTVYLPQGRYRITSPLTIPKGVELRGSYGTARARAYAEGCSLEACVGADTKSPDTDEAFVTLSENSGIRGFTIAHPEQPYDVKQLRTYPYTIRGKGKGVWIVDVMLLNSYYGVDLATYQCDNHLVKGVWAMVYYKGINVGGNSHGGRLEHMCFSYGPLTECGRMAAIRTKEGREAIHYFCGANSIFYLFGDCVGETTWGLAGFIPRVQFHFYKDKGRGCTDAVLWQSMHDVASKANIQVDSGENISFIGYFGSGSGEGKYNCIEVADDVKGPINVYASTIQPPFINHPITNPAKQFHLFDEASLTTGKPVTASATDPGSAPANAVDRDPRSSWQAPGGSYLEVDLGQTRTVTGFGARSAGMYFDLRQNIVEAELQVSEDGKSFTPAGTAYAKPGGDAQAYPYSWADTMVTPVRARYVRLYVTKPGADGKIRVANFDVFGY